MELLHGGVTKNKPRNVPPDINYAKQEHGTIRLQNLRSSMGQRERHLWSKIENNCEIKHKTWNTEAVTLMSKDMHR